MKVYVLKFFFSGDDIENVIKGVYSTKERAINEIMKQVEHENNNNISEYDRPLEKSDNNELSMRVTFNILVRFILKLKKSSLIKHQCLIPK